MNERNYSIRHKVWQWWQWCCSNLNDFCLRHKQLGMNSRPFPTEYNWPKHCTSSSCSCFLANYAIQLSLETWVSDNRRAKLWQIWGIHKSLHSTSVISSHLKSLSPWRLHFILHEWGPLWFRCCLWETANKNPWGSQKVAVGKYLQNNVNNTSRSCLPWQGISCWLGQFS